MWTDFEIRVEFAGLLQQRIVRPRNIGTANTILALDGYAHSALAKLAAGNAGRAQAKRALAAFQVGHTHSGKQHALKLLWRKRDRNANHGTENSRVTQPVPERRALPHGLDFRLAEWNGIFSNLQMPLRPLDFRRRKIRQIIAGIARQKIVDVVFARIHPGHARRPSHRRNRRKRPAQLAEGSSVPQLREVWQPAFVHESVGELATHTLESQNHRSLKRRLSVCVSPPDKPEQLAERPSHQRVERIEERNKDRPER